MKNSYLIFVFIVALVSSFNTYASKSCYGLVNSTAIESFHNAVKSTPIKDIQNNRLKQHSNLYVLALAMRVSAYRKSTNNDSEKYYLYSNLLDKLINELKKRVFSEGEKLLLREAYPTVKGFLQASNFHHDMPYRRL